MMQILDKLAAKKEKIKQYSFVIRELTRREIKRKYARSALGIVWSVLNPLLRMIVISLVFSKMFSRSIDNYPLYLLTGQMFWGLFSDATNHSMSALMDNKNLLIKSKLPKNIFMLSRIYTALINFGYTLIAYVLILFVFNIPLTWTMFLLIPDVLLGLILSMGVGYILSVSYVFFADIKHLYSVFLTLLLYLSAIFYPLDALPDFMQRFISFNPVYIMINIARECVMYARLPHFYEWEKLGIWSISLFVIGCATLKYKENMIMQSI